MGIPHVSSSVMWRDIVVMWKDLIELRFTVFVFNVLLQIWAITVICKPVQHSWRC